MNIWHTATQLDIIEENQHHLYIAKAMQKACKINVIVPTLWFETVERTGFFSFYRNYFPNFGA